MDTAFQPDAFQGDAFGIFGGTHGGAPDTAFQPDAFQPDAFQIYGGLDETPPAPTGGHPPRRMFRRNTSAPEVIEDEEFVLLI